MVTVKEFEALFAAEPDRKAMIAWFKRGVEKTENESHPSAEEILDVAKRQGKPAVVDHLAFCAECFNLYGCALEV